MSKFIEVTTKDNVIFLLNLSNVLEVVDVDGKATVVLNDPNTSSEHLLESYEDIKHRIGVTQGGYPMRKADNV